MMMTKRKNPRAGRCYELSAKYVSENHDAVLVHGSIQGNGYPRNPHAWVEVEGTDGMIVFDPVLDQHYPAWLYERLMNAKAYVRYTYDEAVRLMVDTGHYGSWDEQSDRVRDEFLAKRERMES